MTTTVRQWLMQGLEPETGRLELSKNAMANRVEVSRSVDTCGVDLSRMSGFSLTATGYLARNPKVVVTADGTYCRFCLTGEDYTEDDEHGRSTMTVQSIWFVATHLLGAAIADSARKGDQLFVVGKVRQHHWTAKGRNEDYTLVVTGFRFGKRRLGPGRPAPPCLEEGRPRMFNPAEDVVPEVGGTYIDPCGDNRRPTPSRCHNCCRHHSTSDMRTGL